MRPNPQKTEKDFGKDLKALEQLPAKTRELLILQDQTEKSTGQENVDLHKMTRDKSKQGDGPSFQKSCRTWPAID